MVVVCKINGYTLLFGKSMTLKESLSYRLHLSSCFGGKDVVIY